MTSGQDVHAAYPPTECATRTYQLLRRVGVEVTRRGNELRWDARHVEVSYIGCQVIDSR